MLICKLLDYASKLSVIGWWLQINPQQTQPLLLMIYTSLSPPPPSPQSRYCSFLPPSSNLPLFISCLLPMLDSPWGKRCRQKVVSCWWEQCRIHSVISGWVGYAESYQPETWSRQCCRQNTYRPPERGWQICPVTEREELQTLSDRDDKASVWRW